MEGLILKIKDQQNEPRFDVLFDSVMFDLNQLFWESKRGLWWSPPPPDKWDGVWRPGTMRQYGRYLCEEFIEFIGYSFDDKNNLCTTPCTWLSYVDSSCWEIYTSLPELVDVLFDRWQHSPSIEVFSSSLQERAKRLRDAGLKHIIDVTSAGPGAWEMMKDGVPRLGGTELNNKKSAWH